MSGRFFALIIVAVAVAAFFLGLADRPPFVATTAPDLVVIVSLSDDKDIGGSLMRLLEGTIKGIRATTVLSKRNINGGGSDSNNNSHNKRALMSAASRYGSPLGSEYLSVGLFLDDPRTVSNPRWAIGYAVDVPYEVAKEMASEMSSMDGSNNVVRAVRISLSSTLSARVPWRSIVTPMIAPRLHWPRGMDLYKTEGRATTCGRHSKGDGDGGCAIPMEAYVTGPKGSREWIDYTIVMGDTTVTFDDLYPEVGTDQQQHSNNQQAQQQVPPDVQEVEPQLQEVEPQQVEPESVVDEAVAESQSQQPDSDASKVGDPAADDVPPAVEPEPEQEARHASETETHESDPQDAPNDKVEEVHAQPDEKADAGGVDDGAASTTQHDGERNEVEEEGGDGNPVVDAEAGEEEGVEHEGEEDGDEHGDEAGEEEEEAHEDEEGEEQEHDEENDGEEAGAEEEEEEESFEEDEGEELNDEGDVVEHFEDDEERHDEF